MAGFIKNQGQSSSLWLALFLVTSIILGFWSSQAWCSRQLPGEMMPERFEEWMGKHGRVYTDAQEKERRYKIFKGNVEYIEAFNKKNEHTYTLGINDFTDLTHQEFLAKYATAFKFDGGQSRFKQEIIDDMSSDYSTSKVAQNVNDYGGPSTELPEHVDWTTKAVTRIKKQGSCGASWALAAVAAVEGLNQIKTGNLISLSAQELIDCMQKYGWANSSFSCQEETDTLFAFEYMVKHNRSLATDDDYPYRGVNGNCNVNQSKAAASGAITITDYKRVFPKDDETMKAAVAQQPISAYIDSTSEAFMHYNGGIFSGPCDVFTLTQAVTIVGYDTDEYGTDYWVIKNSWGEEWGEGGYMNVQRQHCNLNVYAGYPIT